MATTRDAGPDTPPLDDLTLRAIDTYSKRRGLDSAARRLLLSAIQDLTLSFLSAWNQMREAGTTSERLFADLLQTRLQLDEAREWAEIIAACRAELEPRRRNHYGKPKHLVSDQGVQFTSELFKDFVARRGIQMRRGKVGEFHSVSLIDRFFRTLKESLGVPRLRPWNFKGLADFKRRLDLALVHYSYVRPHEGIDGVAPIEKYFRMRGHLPIPVSPPRGRAGDPGPELPFQLAYLDPDNRSFPVVFPKAA